jgi:hypothetical protein
LAGIDRGERFQGPDETVQKAVSCRRRDVIDRPFDITVAEVLQERQARGEIVSKKLRNPDSVIPTPD